MQIIVILIAISLAIAIVFLVIFRWNMTSGQYDDTYTPSVRMLFDDKPVAEKPTKEVITKTGQATSDLTDKTS